MALRELSLYYAPFSLWERVGPPGTFYLAPYPIYRECFFPCVSHSQTCLFLGATPFVPKPVPFLHTALPSSFEAYYYFLVWYPGLLKGVSFLYYHFIGFTLLVSLFRLSIGSPIYPTIIIMFYIETFIRRGALFYCTIIIVYLYRTIYCTISTSLFNLLDYLG